MRQNEEEDPEYASMLKVIAARLRPLRHGWRGPLHAWSGGAGDGETVRWERMPKAPGNGPESSTSNGGGGVVPWSESNVRAGLRRVLRNHGFPKPS